MKGVENTVADALSRLETVSLALEYADLARD